MARIHRLPDPLVNQIAAGEVVERPASVLKELIENSLDAGASTVAIRLAAGGRDLVEVEDDGCGIPPEDLLLAVERHATSKLSSAADLACIATLGFRGEALPSIAAVSHLLIESATADGAGARLAVEYGVVGETEPSGRAHGTLVRVRDLFARLPARRKFLRTVATELRHCTGVVTAFAFVRPDVALSLEHGARSLIRLPSAPHLAGRLPDLVGPQRASAATTISARRADIQVSGVLLPRTGTGEIVLAVNGRVVKDRLMAAAVNRALRDAGGALQTDLLLELRMPTEQVDINVHPTKAEVRFSDPGAVMSAITAALATGRVSAHTPPPVRTVTLSSPGRGSGEPAASRGHTVEAGWRPPARPSAGATAPFVTEAFPPVPPGPLPSLATSWGRYVGQYRDTYLILEDAEGLLLVDQHNAHERVLFDRLLAAKHRPPVQRLLLPEVLELSPAQAALAEEVAVDLAALGVEIEAASGGSLRVLGVPSPLPAERAGELVAGLLRDLVDGGQASQPLRTRAAASLACRSAIKKSTPLSAAEAARLLEDLRATRDPQRCPHGRPIMVRLTHDEIERRVGRR